MQRVRCVIESNPPPAREPTRYMPGHHLAYSVTPMQFPIHDDARCMRSALRASSRRRRGCMYVCIETTAQATGSSTCRVGGGARCV